MRQLGNLIKHELIDNLTSGRYILTSIVCSETTDITC